MFENLNMLIESVTVNDELTDENKKLYLYHLSDQKLEPGTVWSPRVPESYIIQKDLEDSVTPRICFGKTILGALKGISGDLKGKEFNVYIPTRSDSDKPLELHYPTSEEVPDAEDLGEVWITSDARMVYVGKIKVTDHQIVSTEYGGGKGTIKRDDYGYEWVGGKNLAHIAPSEAIDRKMG